MPMVYPRHGILAIVIADWTVPVASGAFPISDKFIDTDFYAPIE